MHLAEEHLRTLSFADLRAEGMTRSAIQLAVQNDHLFHARRDNYVAGSASDAIKGAVRVGGRLDCVSLMRELGVYVMGRGTELHVQMERGRHWMRSPCSRAVRLDRAAHGVVTHWRCDDVDAQSAIANIPHAVAQAVMCQRPRDAIATLDSALHTGVLTADALTEVFGLLPRRRHGLRALVDGRAESGPETFARLILRALGGTIDLQMWIHGVGRVDIVVDGWIIVECDSRAHHAGWEQQERDRMRDLAAAELGYATLRPTARQIVQEPWKLLRAVAGLRRARSLR